MGIKQSLSHRNKNYLSWIVVLGLVLVLSGILLIRRSQNPPIPTREEIPLKSIDLQVKGSEQDDNYFSVKRVIDGDTIELTDGVRVRYIGIDTPEAGDCFGNEATIANSSLLNDKHIVLEEDIEKLDRYGRKLAYIWVEGMMVNEELVKRGAATVTTYPPNIKYVDRFINAQQEAKEMELGIWGKNVCSDDKGSVEGVSISKNDNCLIKGNISQGGEKIFHTPGQRYYDKTQIDESKGERWFCNEEDAINEGWRKSKV